MKLKKKKSGVSSKDNSEMILSWILGCGTIMKKQFLKKIKRGIGVLISLGMEEKKPRNGGSEAEETKMMCRLHFARSFRGFFYLI